ncbi:hypothetical protein BSKO_05924 [Bryopsis sp. KO-2023]|nr:hypothetical protein BSKO_05924 [Bryopsis sp. KO-2023]
MKKIVKGASLYAIKKTQGKEAQIITDIVTLLFDPSPDTKGSLKAEKCESLERVALEIVGDEFVLSCILQIEVSAWRKSIFDLLRHRGSSKLFSKTFSEARSVLIVALMYSPSETKSKTARLLSLSNTYMGDFEKAENFVHMTEIGDPKSVLTAMVRLKMLLAKSDEDAASIEIDGLPGCQDFHHTYLETAYEEVVAHQYPKLAKQAVLLLRSSAKRLGHVALFEKDWENALVLTQGAIRFYSLLEPKTSKGYSQKKKVCFEATICCLLKIHNANPTKEALLAMAKKMISQLRKMDDFGELDGESVPIWNWNLSCFVECKMRREPNKLRKLFSKYQKREQAPSISLGWRKAAPTCKFKTNRCKEYAAKFRSFKEYAAKFRRKNLLITPTSVLSAKDDQSKIDAIKRVIQKTKTCSSTMDLSPLAAMADIRAGVLTKRGLMVLANEYFFVAEQITSLDATASCEILHELSQQGQDGQSGKTRSQISTRAGQAASTGKAEVEKVEGGGVSCDKSGSNRVRLVEPGNTMQEEGLVIMSRVETGNLKGQGKEGSEGSGEILSKDGMTYDCMSNQEVEGKRAVKLLTNPASCGYVENPISVHYCYSQNGDLEKCIAERGEREEKECCSSDAWNVEFRNLAANVGAAVLDAMVENFSDLQYSSVCVMCDNLSRAAGCPDNIADIVELAGDLVSKLRVRIVRKFHQNLSLEVEGCRNIYEWLLTSCKVEELEGANQIHVEGHGLVTSGQVQFYPTIDLEARMKDLMVEGATPSTTMRYLPHSVVVHLGTPLEGSYCVYVSKVF